MIGAISVAAGPSLGFGFNLSRSAPRGIYWTAAGAPIRGRLVIACLPAAIASFGRSRGYLGAGSCPGAIQPVLKRVGAVAGDVVELTGESATVNDVQSVTRRIQIHDSTGRPLPHVEFGRYRVPPDEIWLFGVSHASSWDSRYFGPVRVTAVRGVVEPVLTVDRGLR